MQARTFYDDLNAIVKQLGKMETFLATSKQVGLLPETLRTQQRLFMVSQLTGKSVFFSNSNKTNLSVNLTNFFYNVKTCNVYRGTNQL